jgi:hypothetical protein
MSQPINAAGAAGLTDEELAQESAADLPVREAMSLVDLGGLTSQPLPALPVNKEPLPVPTVVNDSPV